MPAARRAALIFENMPATTGVEADVPAILTVSPKGLVADGMRTAKLVPAADISGIPLPPTE
jgi:hypothetical protein